VLESVTKLGSCVLAVAAALSLTSAAFANSPSPPPGTPSIGQYVETVPTAKGGSTAGVGTAQTTHLPPAIEARLRSLTPAVAKRLETIATSSAYGAPQQGSPSSGAANPSSSFSAAVASISGSSDKRIFWLLGTVIVVTTAMIVATARRHRA
jgi:hypothetical protein